MCTQHQGKQRWHATYPFEELRGGQELSTPVTDLKQNSGLGKSWTEMQEEPILQNLGQAEDLETQSSRESKTEAEN